MAADPPIVYWNGATLAAMETVWRLRTAGTGTFFTIDAGPHVKVLCAASDATLGGARAGVDAWGSAHLVGSWPGAEVVLRPGKRR